MAHLFTIAPSGYEIHGDPYEPGPWSCTCPHGQDHLRPGHLRGYMCKHLASLFAGAEERDEVDVNYFVPTDDGETVMDHCRCKGLPERKLKRIRIYKASAAKTPGEPSRNKPCPCGWVDTSYGPPPGRQREYKRCHGAPGGPPDGAPPWGLEASPEEKRKAKRRASDKARREREKGKRLDMKARVSGALESGHKLDAERREARQRRAARKKGPK